MNVTYWAHTSDILAHHKLWNAYCREAYRELEVNVS